MKWFSLEKVKYEALPLSPLQDFLVSLDKHYNRHQISSMDVTYAPQINAHFE